MSLKFLSIAILALAPTVFAQQTLVDAFPEASEGTAATVVSAPKPAEPKALTARWLDLTTFSHSERYRNQYGNDGFHYFESGQHRSLIAGKIKLDAAARYTIGFRASTGRTFNWAYADYAGKSFTGSIDQLTGQGVYGTDSPIPAINQAAASDPDGVDFIQNVESVGWRAYVRELYLSASPNKKITAEFGSFGFERGLSTEITTFDDDGYLTGERLRINDPQHLFFDQVSLTSAYFGFFDTPNLFSRGTGFLRSNYRQVAARKKLSKRVSLSAEYNWISNNAKSHTTRQAIVVETPEARFLDRVRLEAYEMNSIVTLQDNTNARRQGFALVGEKKHGKLSGDFGFASIDRNYGLYTGHDFAQQIGFSLNGDNYNTGIRIFSHLNYKITPVITAFGFYTRLTGALVNDPNDNYLCNIDRQGLNAGLSFDLKALANTTRRIF